MTSPHEQKKRKVNGSVVVTANRLGDGAVVYRTQDRRWSTLLDEAYVTAEAERATALLKEANASDIEAVGAYVAPVILEGTGIQPGNLRERIRRDGPTFALPGAGI